MMMRALRLLVALMIAMVAVPVVIEGAHADDPGGRASRDSSSRRRNDRRRGPRRAEGRRRGGRRPAVSPAYVRMRTRWHKAAAGTVVRRWESEELPPIVFTPVGRAERFEVVPSSPDGGFDQSALEVAQQALAYRRDGSVHEIHPRLLDLVYRAVKHFHAPYVHVVSGYRPTRATSRHSQGRAIDLVLPGISDERLARYLREQGFVGVGVYPLSGFVHLDVRQQSFFWTDSSAPGARTRVRPTLRDEARRVDSVASRRGEEAVSDVVPVEESDEGDEAEETEGEGTGPIARSDS